MIEFATFAGVFVLTYFGVRQFRRWTAKKRILDVPNERSSHVRPTPRGGGLVFVCAALFFYAVSALVSPNAFEWSYLIGAAAIASISWIDDVRSISSVWRFLVHVSAAFLTIWSVGFWEEIYVPFYGSVFPGIWGVAVTLVWIVWLTNAYNFMDGIDGIAGAQAFAAGVGWFLIGSLSGFEEFALFAGVVAFGCLGFLLHNWHPAKIFMGDVGSAFLGYTFAVFPLLAAKESGEIKNKLPIIGASLVWLFVFDTIFTFFRRLLKKEKVWRAHREHVYQKLVIKGYSHRFVAALYGLLSFVTVYIIADWLFFKRFPTPVLFLFIVIQSAAVLILAFWKTPGANRRAE